MIGKCIICKRERKIYAKEKCISCYNILQSKNHPEWQAKAFKNYWEKRGGKKVFNDYMRNYMRKRLNINPKDYRKIENGNNNRDSHL